MLVKPEHGAADGADVDDSGETGVVDDRQVTEVAVRHELGRLAEAGSGSDDGRVRGHHIGDPDVIDVLAVGDDMSDVGVGDNPYRLVSLGVEDNQGRGAFVFHQVCSRGNVIGDLGRGQRRLHDLGHSGWALRPGGTRPRCFCHDPSVSGLRWCRRPKAWTRRWRHVLRHCAGSQSVVSHSPWAPPPDAPGLPSGDGPSPETPAAGGPALLLPALPGYPREVSTLAVVGAGPKGIAIAAKARALAAAGLPAPRVVLVDRGEVAGNWTGRQGYTSGLLPLGTPPEKDIGYPYAASWGDASADVVAAMAQYSWQRHLIKHGVYSDWIDRGRMRPTHRQWSAYLCEVAEAAEVEIVSGVVTGLDVADGDRWMVKLAAGDEIAADGLVMTGAGPPITVPGQPRDHPRVLDGRSYWLAVREMRHERAQNVCVIGSGETAASVVIDLVKRTHKHSAIDVLTSRGVLYSRGESYDENRLYSDPADWPRLAEAHRREFLERTDRGVFSLQAEAALNQACGFRTLAGRAAAIEAREQDVIVTIAYGDERERIAYDAVVVAIGFDGRWFEALLGKDASARYRAALGGDDLRHLIGIDLSVAGLTPSLHLPVMAGLAQGPGFPNLSCLGLLSDRILRPYIAVNDVGALVPARRERA